MKKTVLFAISFVFAAFMISSCTEDCKNCKTQTKDASGNIIQEGTASEYCDDALEAKENEAPVTDGSTTTSWYCE